MYVKCGCINGSHRALGEVLEPNIATWNSIISGSVNRCLFGDVVRLFKEVQLLDLRPNLVTMLSLISACAGLGSEKLCRCIHSFTVKLRIDAHLKVKDVISWTTMINMYGSAGCPVNALQFFWQMRSANVEPDIFLRCHSNTPSRFSATESTRPPPIGQQGARRDGEDRRLNCLS
ncbi:pentatricopeptide repeat-containing protein At2g42920, chloroplastic-like [Nymphaea colorata]|nr:pentatricopeptide repeat-containing protein At2g42920, chloroplastic-like [Nymphaea colorata]